MLRMSIQRPNTRGNDRPREEHIEKRDGSTIFVIRNLMECPI